MVWKHGTPGDLYTPPNPWRHESPRESPADCMGVLHFHLSVTEIKESHTSIQKDSHQEKPFGYCTKSEKKTGMFVRTYVHTYMVISCPQGTHIHMYVLAVL